ncbi:unnamed protein product [Vicia faba]|uniref:Uncharacterized protein n=1 Tax=Vicia faba TaxID=3906 RepID=A0AAV0Z4N9_VICFA|nr:unnamed protein product [Vicia faba]
MRRFLVARKNIENMNIVQPEAELEPLSNGVNDFNPNEILCDPVDDVKARLATTRESGWDNLFSDVQNFCVAKGIPWQGRTITDLHHYRAEISYVVIDKICVEIDHHFSEGINIILNYFSCIDSRNSFSKFNIDKLARLADIYHADFSSDDRGTIRDQLDTYVL